MMPFKSRVRARAFEEYSDWVRHDGEEFLLILEGEVMFYSEFYGKYIWWKGTVCITTPTWDTCWFQ